MRNWVTLDFTSKVIYEKLVGIAEIVHVWEACIS